MQNCGIVKIYHKNNCNSYVCECNELEGIQLKLEYFQNNGSKEGVYKEYYLNKNLNIECNFIDNKLNGIMKKYFPDGTLWLEYDYIDNKPISIRNMEHA